MTRIIIHIGTHKTGTTAFQKAMVNERLAIESKGIFYQWMDLSHDKHERAYLDIGSSQATDKSRHAFVETVKSAIVDGRTIILSEEGLSEPGNIFAKTLAPLSEVADVSVVCVLRPQHELLERLWAQHLRERKTNLTIEEFTETENSIERGKYHTMIGHWASVFGKDCLTVLNYENIKKDSANGIFRALGLDHEFDEKFPPQNWTPNAQKTRLIEFLNTIGADYDVQEILKAGKPADSPSSHSLMTNGQRSKIQDRFEAENRSLEVDFGIRFSDTTPLETLGRFSERDVYDYMLEGFLANSKKNNASKLFQAPRVVARYVLDKIRL